MYKSISPVQTVSELKFVGSYQPETFFVPLDLETFLYCKIHKNRFLNPIHYLDPSFHEMALNESAKFTDNMPVISNILAIQSEIVALLRHYLYQIFFIESLLNNIIDNEKINVILVSGWNICSSISYSAENYFTSRIVESLFGYKVKKIDAVYEKAPAFVHDYNFRRTKIQQVLINSFGYNFKRLSKACNQRSISTSAIVFDNLTNKQRISAWLRGYQYVTCKSERRPFSAETFPITLDNKIKEKLINERMEEIMPHILTQLNKCRLIDQFLDNKRPSFSASWSMRGISGYLLERSHQLKIPSIAIPHGTIAPAFDKSDKIYKNIIAEAVFSGVCTHVALQSKITKDALKTQPVIGNPILTGNLIFEEISQIKGKHILYAVTLKSFFNMQYFGVEMYYEFFKNLTCLVSLQESVGLPVLVQLHPSVRKSKEKLETLFPMLSFAAGSISTCLRKSILTISYSSTVIEDSLYSNVPVILFDQWKRYQHCNAETDPYTKKKAVYYVTDLEGLITATHTITSSQNTEFSTYTYRGESSKNFKSLIQDLL